uniref:SFRICE_012503 n=1 Tax=Spodoptera frugiperda TaxID=7108 RepID=A0A2H1X0A7_SPOFR
MQFTDLKKRRLEPVGRSPGGATENGVKTQRKKTMKIVGPRMGTESKVPKEKADPPTRQGDHAWRALCPTVVRWDFLSIVGVPISLSYSIINGQN